MSRLRTLILAIVIMVVVVGVVIVSLSVQSPRVYAITIFNDQETVSTGTYNPHLFTIPSGASNSSVSGTFTAQGGSDDDIKIYIIDSANFGSYANNDVFSFFYYSGQIHTVSFSVNLPSGDYYLVLDNKFSTSSQKLVSIQMNAIYTK